MILIILRRQCFLSFIAYNGLEIPYLCEGWIFYCNLIITNQILVNTSGNKSVSAPPTEMTFSIEICTQNRDLREKFPGISGHYSSSKLRPTLLLHCGFWHICHMQIFPGNNAHLKFLPFMPQKFLTFPIQDFIEPKLF